MSVVLLNFNGKSFGQLWESFFLEPYPDKELIFVDNGSADGSASIFQELMARHPGVRARVVRLPQNVGYSRGCNAGAAEARGEVLVLVNNDIEVSPTWIAPVLDAFASDAHLGVAQSSLFDLQKRDRPDRVWNTLDVFGFAHPSELGSADLCPVFYGEGASLFVRRTMLEELGELYPSEFYLLGEDSDLCWRAHLRGWGVSVVRGSIAWHARGGTEEGSVTKRSPRVLQAVTRNRLAMLYTNYGTWRMTLLLPLSAALAGLRGLALWTKGDRVHARAVLRGLVGFLRDGDLLRARRAKVQATRTCGDPQATSLMMGAGEGLRALWGLWEESAPRREG